MPAMRKPLRTKKESIAIHAVRPSCQMNGDSDFGHKWFRSTMIVPAARRPSSSGMRPRNGCPEGASAGGAEVVCGEALASARGKIVCPLFRQSDCTHVDRLTRRLSTSESYERRSAWDNRGNPGNPEEEIT